MKRISPSTIIASTALFFSFGGIGLAASHYIITSTSQIKPSVLRHLRGVRGPSGAAGSQGPAGLPTTATAFAPTAVDYVAATEVTLCGSGGGACATATSTAVCTHGALLAGGWNGAPGEPFNPPDTTVWTNGPAADSKGWTVTITNHNAQTYTFHATAICL